MRVVLGRQLWRISRTQRFFSDYGARVPNVDQVVREEVQRLQDRAGRLPRQQHEGEDQQRLVSTPEVTCHVQRSRDLRYFLS